MRGRRDGGGRGSGATTTSPGQCVKTTYEAFELMDTNTRLLRNSLSISSATGTTSSPTSTSGSTGMDQPDDHRAYRQGRVLVHPSRPAPNPDHPGGRTDPDLPRLVSLRGPAERFVPADRQRGTSDACAGHRRAGPHEASAVPGRGRQPGRGNLPRALLAWHASTTPEPSVARLEAILGTCWLRRCASTGPGQVRSYPSMKH